ncbi:acetyltransferase, putative [Labilithrix luteola]|uniref:Acetyltransferase, putative n=1 Tax=Labilithrix luteola TaxID=1391654 RepID=A0A0K1Q6V5_9BACT|nr:GNAT family protein [Labilithrix luteola]AKV01449.1 acetyltransferase, putative [Labilithrix luteola]
MQLTPVVLEGIRVRLEPLRTDLLDELARAALSAPVELWTYIPYRMGSREDLGRLFEHAMAMHEARSGITFLTRLRATGEVVGGTSMLCVDATHRRLEIGFTWILPRWQRTFVNTEVKLLQLTHAFEVLRAMRVEFKTDANNARSRAALGRLGATEEGMLRRHMFRWDGSVRDSTMFSIVDTDWPLTKPRLESLVGVTP